MNTKNLIENIIDRTQQIKESTKSKSVLQKELEDAFKQYVIDINKGVEDFDLESELQYVYLADVSVKDDGKRTRVTFSSEMYYEEFEKVINEYLNPVIQKYDKDAYFEMEEPGISIAYIDTRLTESIKEAKEYDLVGIDGNAYSIMGYVQKAMKEQGFSQEEINSYLDDAKSSDYNHLLAVSMDMIDRCNNKDVENSSESENKASEPEENGYNGGEDKGGVDWSYFNKFEKLDDKYLPASGEGDNMATQLATATSKLIYKWYNDGDVFDNTYGLDGWANDLSSYANWLYKYIPESKSILDEIKTIYTQDEYEQLLKKLCDTCFTEEKLKELEQEPKKGSVYSENGPFEFDDSPEEDEYDDYWDEDEYDDEY